MWRSTGVTSPTTPQQDLLGHSEVADPEKQEERCKSRKVRCSWVLAATLKMWKHAAVDLVCFCPNVPVGRRN